jgi:histidine triad (HIT) family protein
MYNHGPPGYDCPFCRLARGDRSALSTQDDVVYHDDTVTAFIPSHFWEHNKGHVIVIPNTHVENLYDLPDALGAAIGRMARRVALALKACYACDGVSTRQHNEPGANQEVWHYHLHVFPRYMGDNLYGMPRRATTAEERRPYAAQLRAYFAAHPPAAEG